MRTRRTLITLALLVMTMLVTTSNAKAQQVNVKTLFYMLPVDAFLGLSLNDQSELEKYIKVCDYRNGYLSLKSEERGKWEMCYWNLKDGSKLVATSNNGSFPFYSFYLYNNGKLTATTKFGIEEIHSAIDKSIAMNCCDNWINVYVPRQGTSVFLTVNGLESQIYKWQNERFVRLNEYPTQNSTHQQLLKGFVAALNRADVDRCLQYILPSYVSEQCMGVFEGNKEQFLCELISGEDEKGYLKPTKLSDIKKATYRYTPDDGFANHTVFIELKNGSSYSYYPSLETVEIYELLPGGEAGELLRAAPYIVGAVG